jgi:transcriptional regulator with XRE-family HTH domain
MPRIAKPHTDESQLMRQLLREYLKREGITANRLSSAAQVGQPTVSRFLTGRTKTVTPAISTVLTYAGIERLPSILRITVGVDNPRLRAALERNWDGSAEGAEKLAVMIDAIGPMLRSMRLSSAAGRSK